MREVDSQASWRDARMTHWDVLIRLREAGKIVSPLFDAPGVRMCIFKLDWLHIVDLGIASEFFGALLFP